MQPRHILTGAMGGRIFQFDLVERHRRGVDQPRVRRAVFQQFLRHDRAGIEANRAAREQVAAAHGNEVGSAWSGADEMHRHLPPPLTAMAQATRTDHKPRTQQYRIGACRRQGRSLANRSHSGQFERPFGVADGAACRLLQFGAADDVQRQAELIARHDDAGFVQLDVGCRHRVKVGAARCKMVERTRNRRQNLISAYAPPAAYSRDHHGFTQHHCVTGRAGRQPLIEPI